MQPNIAIEEVPNKFRLEAWSLKGQLVNNGRCPKWTLKLPWKHYKTFEEIQKDPTSLPRKKQNSLFNRQIDISTRSCLNSSGTTKDYSSIQKYLNSARNKDLMNTKRRAIEVTANEMSSDHTLEDNRASENTSIFTQKVNQHRKTPKRERIDNSQK
jgi:hypothetical protein